MLAVLLNFLFTEHVWVKYRFLAPAFFFIWANLHGSFVMGLFAFVLVLGTRFIVKKRVDVVNFAILLISILAATANPYKTQIWREVWSSVSDNRLRWVISEWMPGIIMLHFPMAVFVALSLVFVYKKRIYYSPEEIIVYFAFLFLGLTSKRHLPLWAIVSLPITEKGISLFYRDVSKIKYGKKRFKTAYRATFVFVTVAVMAQMIFDYYQASKLNETHFYPKNAVSYLRENPTEGQIFSDYGWGGYLIWKFPEKKVFIDGRMPSWRWIPPSESESKSAFDDYNNILKGKEDYKKYFEKYSIRTVLLPRPKPKTKVSNIYNVLAQAFPFTKHSVSDFGLFEELEKDGWKKVYDDKEVIYVSP
jgi:hypothetical protein